MRNDCSLSNVNTDFYKGHPRVSISIGLFLLVLERDSQKNLLAFLKAIGSSIAEKSSNQRNAAILQGINLGSQRA